MNKDQIYSGLIFYFVLYFFLNNFLLPEGLLYTTLLSPVFIYWLYKNHRLSFFFKWLLLLLIPVPFQWVTGFQSVVYFKSFALIVTAFIFLNTAILAVKDAAYRLNAFFKTILVINSALVVIALIFLPFPFLREIFWNSIPISPDVPGFPRLKLFAYEPSHYALLLSPVFIYFILKIFTGKTKHPLLLSAAVAIPLLLSLSFGVLGALILALLITTVLFSQKLGTHSRRLLFYSLLFLGVAIVVILLIWPDNPVLLRIDNIIEGKDTSAKGRLYTSFMFAFDLAKSHNLFFGVGPGQTKILAHDFIVNYYQYTGDFATTVRIPNSMGEMFATFGLYGFLLKIFIEIYFFIRLKVYKNMFSISLFLFIFIYQFTGSFLMNIAELGTWALVYQSRFNEFSFDQINEST